MADRPSIEPRGLQRELAARYVGISPSKFDDMVEDGRMPAPKMIDRRKVWDRRALDAAFERLPDSNGVAGGREDGNWFDAHPTPVI